MGLLDTMPHSTIVLCSLVIFSILEKGSACGVRRFGVEGAGKQALKPVLPCDVQGFNSVPQSPSAAGAELAMWQLASRMGSLGMQPPPPPPQPQQQSPQPSPFAGAVRDPWGRTTDEQMAAASLFSNGGGAGGAFELQHCESAPAGLFQEELRQLRKLGLTETLGLVRASPSCCAHITHPNL